MDIELAPIAPADRQAIIDLFNYYVEHGFAEVGRFRQVCIKNGTPFDVVWMQKML